MISIAATCIPRQMNTQKSMPNPKEFSPDEWRFNPVRAQEYDWRAGNAIQSDYNYFAKNEGYQSVKNGMFKGLTGKEPIYGWVNYTLNPLDNEQTNAHMSGYGLQKQTRVANNMTPAGVMRFPAYKYPVTSGPNPWMHVYEGSTTR